MKNRKAKRFICLVLAVILSIPVLSLDVMASGTSDDSLTVFDALGFDTDAPDGYNENEDITDTPYGREYTTMFEVPELLMEPAGVVNGAGKGALYGYNVSEVQDYDTFFRNEPRGYRGWNTPSVASGEKGVYSIAVEGNFLSQYINNSSEIKDVNYNGRKWNVATLVMRPVIYSEETNDTDGGEKGDVTFNYKTVRGELSLYVGNYNNTEQYKVFTYGSDEGYGKGICLGNKIDVDWKDTAKAFNQNESNYDDDGDFVNEYMAYNYMKMAAGDYDGDGTDEIAVYIPTMSTWYHNEARVEIYDYQIGFKKEVTGNWEKAFDIPLQLRDTNGNVHTENGYGRVPNMVSLSSGDFNQDGVDDLAVSYGFISQHDSDNGFVYSTEHNATIRWGAPYSEEKGTYMLAESVDFPLTTADGDSLVRTTFTAGDADGDGVEELVLGGSVLGEDAKTRYVSVYEWNGSTFSRAAEKNFDPFEKMENSSTRVYENIEDENTYYSRVNMAANIAVGSFYGKTESPAIYMDSLMIGYNEEGELTILDMIKNNSLYLNGHTDNYHYVEYGARAADLNGSGTDVLITRAHYYQKSTPTSGTVEHVLQSMYTVARDRDFHTSTAVLNFTKDTSQTDAKKMHSVKTLKYEHSNNKRRTALRFALPDCDLNDTVIMRYTGEHYYSYADPEVLAVLASPPHFKDLESVADNQMMESSTSYASSTGTGSGSSHTHGFSAGIYAGYEQDISIFGIKIASYEFETEINNSFTWEFQQTSSLEYEINYSTQVGQDSVVLYAMPVETYVYEAIVPGSEPQTVTVNIPYEPSVEVVSLEKYNKIYQQYSDVIPEIEDVVLTHTVGEPSSYPTSEGQLPASWYQILSYPGNAMKMGYGQTVTQQTISMTQESEKSFNWECEVSFKAGGGAGGVKAGVMVGTTHGAGKVNITTSGSSFSAEMQALPNIAEEYGYGFNWRMTSFLYKNMYPVVTYLVTSVTQPPRLPENFSANDELTTDDAIALEWDYTGSAVGFNLYRYYTTTAGADYYLIDTISMNDFTDINEDGSYHFMYMDENLIPGNEYRYKIQTIGSGQPNLSIFSEELITYTKPENTPVLSVTARELNAYPDTVVSSKVVIDNAEEIGDAKLHYQWEKKNDKGKWTSINSMKNDTLSVRYGSEDDAGVYRCRVTAMLEKDVVTVYSPDVTINLERRNAQFKEVTVDSENGVITATLTGIDTYSVPGGDVIFTLSGTASEISYSATIENGIARIDNVGVEDGVYSVTCYYSGNRVFYPVSYEPDEPVFFVQGMLGSSTQFLDIREKYTYGDNLNFTLFTFDENGNITDTLVFGKDELSAITLKKYVDEVGRYRSFDDYAANNLYFAFAIDASGGTDTVTNRFNGNRAGWVGKYCFDYTINGRKTTYYFEVEPAVASVSGLEESYAYTEDTISGIDLKAMQRSVSYEGLMDFSEQDGLNDLTLFKEGPYIASHWQSVNYRRLAIMDRNGQPYFSGSNVGAGAYTIQFNPTRDNLKGIYGGNYIYSQGFISDNYIIESWPSATLVVSGPVYNVTATVEPAEYGKVSVIAPKDATKAASGQTVIFRVEPYEGYEVETWLATTYYNSDDLIDHNNPGETTFSKVISDKDMHVVVRLREKSNTLTVNALPDNPTVNGETVENKVITDNEYFTNGNTYAAGYEMNFEPVAAEGWHFVQWEYIEVGRGSIFSDEPTYKVTMPDSSVILNAVFARDEYKLTLGDNLNAYDADGKQITNLDAIEGDTQITVKAASGFEIAEDASWTANDILLDTQPTNGEYTFNITADTVIGANVAAKLFDVGVTQAENGTAKVDATVNEDGKVEGGSEVDFTAQSDRGYAFDKWIDADGNTVSTDNPYTVKITEDINLTPTFSAQTAKEVSLATKGGGAIDWQIEGVNEDYTDRITLYPGEEVVLTAVPNSGRMIAGWDIDGAYEFTRNDTNTFSYDELPSSVTVNFKFVTYFTVKYDDNIKTTADSISVNSGDKVGSGSKMEFFCTNADFAHPMWFNTDEGTSTQLGIGSACTIDILNSNLDISVEEGREVKFDTRTEGLTVASQIVLSGTTVSEPVAPVRDNYTFSGWYTDPQCADEYLYDFNKAVTEDITLYAKWIEDYVVTFSDDIAATADDVIIASGDRVVVDSKIVFTYKGTDIAHPVWIGIQDNKNVKLGTGGSYTVEALSENLDISVKEGREVVFDTRTEDLTVEPQIVLNGTSVKEPEALVRDDHTFCGWYTTPECADEDLYEFNKAVTKDITLYAKWLRDYTVTFGDDIEVTADDIAITSGDRVVDGSKVIFTYTGSDTTNPIWIGVTDDKDEEIIIGDTYTIDALSADLDVSVGLGREVVFDTQAEGLTVDSQIVLSGTVIMIPETPIREGYIFGGWYTGAGCTDEELYDFTEGVTSDITLYAKWILPQDNSTGSQIAGGSTGVQTGGEAVSQPTGITSSEEQEAVVIPGKKAASLVNGKMFLTWSKTEDVDGYDIFVTECSKKFKKKNIVKTIKKATKLSATIKKLSGRKLKPNGKYKARVYAYRIVDVEKTYVAKSLTYHFVGNKNKKLTNPDKIKIANRNITLNVEESTRINARIVKQKKGRKLLSKKHGPLIHYISEDESIAVVNKKGKITAKAKGTCTIHVIAINGISREISMTVN